MPHTRRRHPAVPAWRRALRRVRVPCPRWLKALTFWAVALSAPVTLVSAWGGWFDPETWALPAIMAMAFPVLWVATLLLLLWSALARARWACGAALLVLLGCAWPALTYCPLNIGRQPRPDERPRSFTVMTFNTLWWGRAYPPSIPCEGNPSVAYLLEADPDILCTQENDGVGHSKVSGGTQAQVDSVLARYPYREVSRLKHGFEGLTIYSKYPITRILEQEAMSASAIYAAYRISIQGRLLTVVNCHLQSLSLSDADKAAFAHLMGSDSDGWSMANVRELRGPTFAKLYAAYKERARQGHELLELARQVKGNLIICGDFNDVPGCHAVRTIMEGGLRDAFRDAGFGLAPTFRSNNMHFRIDHILYRGDLRAVRAWRGGGSSDHFPLLATFVWDRDKDIDGE